ncbi:MAG: hypothetical protein ABI211_23695 [Vicinamibacterales bacterium]
MTNAGRWAWGGAAVMALALAIALQIGRDAAYPRGEASTERLLYTRSGPAVTRLALEFRAIAADLYWIRAIQHYGGDRLAPDRRQRYELLQPLLDLTTTLDPYFTVAYRFGAIFLSEQPPSGPGRPDQAIALLEKGTAAQPDKWEYLHDIAFVHYWHQRDPAGAADYFRRAAATPGAPGWLQPLAATMLSARDRSSARVLWQQILESDQPWLRRTAERSLSQLAALDQIEALQALVDRSGITAGRRVTWLDLMRRGVIRGLPVDPTGVPYQLDPDTARVTLAAASSLNPMPDLSSTMIR